MESAQVQNPSSPCIFYIKHTPIVEVDVQLVGLIKALINPENMTVEAAAVSDCMHGHKDVCSHSPNVTD